jgi:ribosomal protein S21
MSDIKEKKQIILPENVPTDYTFERMLKSFMKEIDKSGILKEVKARKYYIKPSEIKRLAKKSKRRNNG